MNFDVIKYREALKKYEIAIVGFPVKASLTYLPNGAKLREKLYGTAITELKRMGYEQVILSDFIDIETLQKIDAVSKLSGNYLPISDSEFCMTAGHEISCYSLVKEQLRDHSVDTKFPIKYFHFGTVFRMPKNTRFPFNYGERKSFLECYGIYKTSAEAESAIGEATLWNRRIVKEWLKLPGMEVERPHVTNKAISKRSIHIDTITPLGETIITGMTYWHDDVFTKALNVRRRNHSNGKNEYVYSTHFGLSENVLHSYLINCYDGEGFKFFTYLAPYQISIIDATSKESGALKSLIHIMDKNGYDYETVGVKSSQIHKMCDYSLKKGVPVVVILKDTTDAVEIKIASCGTERKLDIDQVEGYVKECFAKHNEMVESHLRKVEEENIVFCDSIEAVMKTVSESKVAKFYCNKSDDNALKVESYLTGGEVLGFEKAERGTIDIFGNYSDYIAYASRRS